MPLLLVAGTALVEFVTVAGGSAASPYPIFYFLLATCACCFLAQTEAAALLALIMIAYGSGLALIPGSHDSDLFRWVVFALALAVGGAFIGTVRAKHDQLASRLRTGSQWDPVTGFLNTRGFEEMLKREVERARRGHTRFGLLVAGVDGFVGHETRFGDQEGRKLLGVAAEAIARGKRVIDAVARLHEDEFALVATYTDETGAEALAERINNTARAALEPHGRLAMSLGIAIFPKHGDTPETLLAAARGALVDARELGGDRTLLAHTAEHSIESRMQADSVDVVTTA